MRHRLWSGVLLALLCGLVSKGYADLPRPPVPPPKASMAAEPSGSIVNTGSMALAVLAAIGLAGVGFLRSRRA